MSNALGIRKSSFTNVNDFIDFLSENKNKDLKLSIEDVEVKTISAYSARGNDDTIVLMVDFSTK
jgi:predicted N-acyltransferase